MPVNGKSKGSNFERTIANELSARFAHITGVDHGFRRNPDSGAFFGGTNVARTETYDTDYALYGDLICPRNFNFSIECKHYKTAPPLNAILTQKVSDWDKWINQATQDAKVAQKHMMLIVKYNRTETMVFLESPMYTTIFPKVTYKDFLVYIWKDVLTLDDLIFFNNE